MSMTLKDAHKEALRVFRECQGVEAAFQQMLVEACEPIYLEVLRDATTNAINLPIYTIIQYLYDTYGAISPETLKEKRIEIENIQFDPNLPIDVIFNKIEKFTHLAEAARSPLNQKTVDRFCLQHFSRCDHFHEVSHRLGRETANESNMDSNENRLQKSTKRVKENRRYTS